MFKNPDFCLFDPRRPTKTQYDLRETLTPIAPFGCCGWFAMWYLMFDKAISTPAALREVERSLPLARRFLHKNGMLAGVRHVEFDYVFRLNGFVLRKEARTSEEDRLVYLGLYLKKKLSSGTFEPGTKFLLRVDNSQATSHAIAVHVTSEGRMLIIDQVTSCFIEHMHGNRRFGQWYYCEDFVLLRVLAVPENPATRARALARNALAADARVRRLARVDETNVRRLRAFRERGCWSGARGAAFRKWRRVHNDRMRSNVMLARAQHEALAEQRLAENAGAVFERRRRARGLPRGLPRARRALQPLALDRAGTARALEPRCAAWARASADAREQTICCRLDKIETLVSGNTCRGKSTVDRIEGLERLIGIPVLFLSDVPILNRLARIEEILGDEDSADDDVVVVSAQVEMI
jgi:hypothetical protein